LLPFFPLDFLWISSGLSFDFPLESSFGKPLGLSSGLSFGKPFGSPFAALSLSYFLPFFPSIFLWKVPLENQRKIKRTEGQKTKGKSKKKKGQKDKGFYEGKKGTKEKVKRQKPKG
jgi:hypothetical protein